MDPSREDFSPPAGSRVGSYELVREVGKGCFGVVYLARGADGLHVALKLLRGAEGHLLEVFEHEKRWLEKARSALPAARVVRLVEGWQEEALGGCYCLAMTPCCSGGSLEKLIRRCSTAPVDLRTRLRWALEVAETLQLLQSDPDVRLFHGDVTPRNVALHRQEGEEGEGRLEAYLLDLGVSRHNHPHGMNDPPKEHSASVAPEMEQGSGAFDGSADVWGWGVLLYALLSWSVDRVGRPGGEQPRAAWMPELRLEGQEAVGAEQAAAVVDLMLDCLRPREERACLEAVVHGMRRALGYPEAATRLVDLDEELRRGRAAGILAPLEEAELLHCKATEHFILQQHVDVGICLERAVRLCRGSEPPSASLDLLLAKSLNSLASLHESKGEYDPALPLYEEALELRGRGLPPNHPAIAISLNNLAHLLKRMGEYGRALALQEAALLTERQALWPDHRGIATSLSNLAALHEIKGAFERALLLFGEALEIQQRTLPPNDPEIARTINNMAAVHSSMGDHDRALPLYEEALAMSKEALPEGHPDIVTSLNNLALAHKHRGDYDRALPLYQEALEMRKAVLPEGHPDIAVTLNSLGTLHKDMGNYARAQELYERALEMRRSALPPVHKDTARTLHNLAALCDCQGEHDRALPLYEEALEMRKAALGPNHPDVAVTRDSLALLHRSRGDDDSARLVLEEALVVQQAGTLPPSP